MCFENHWAMTGLAEEPRLKRLNAGRPAPKYEPPELNTDTPTKKSNKPVNRNTKTRPKQRGKNEGDETGSKCDDPLDREMDRADIQYIADRLSNLSGSMLEGCLVSVFLGITL